MPFTPELAFTVGCFFAAFAPGFAAFAPSFCIFFAACVFLVARCNVLAALDFAFSSGVLGIAFANGGGGSFGPSSPGTAFAAFNFFVALSFLLSAPFAISFCFSASDKDPFFFGAPFAAGFSAGTGASALFAAAAPGVAFSPFATAAAASAAVKGFFYSCSSLFKRIFAIYCKCIIWVLCNSA